MWLMAAGLLTACASEDTQQKDGTKQSETKYVATFTGHQPNSNNSAKSRTTATHTLGNPAQVIWEARDRIWVKADDGRFYQSEAANFAASATPADHSRANFRLSQGYYATTTPEVRYVGTSTNADRVTIAATQAQASPNDFSHLGEAGDCGTATAHSGALAAGDYEFTLQHKASYLCFVPRCMNTALGPNIKLTEIVVTADKPIAGLYDFSDGSIMGKTPISNSSNVIDLNLDFGYAHPFSLNTTTENTSMNGAYMVIAPGTYNLTITYSIEDVDGHRGNIIKTLNGFTCPEGQIRDIKANLTPPTMTLPLYYMWDAVNPYWYGYESFAPTTDGAQGQHWPDKTGNPGELNGRWYHEGGGPVTANHSCAICPNVNEICWYIMLGDPHWQQGEEYVTARNGHLVNMPNNGMWLKKKSAIIRDNSGTGQAFSAANGGATRFSSGFPFDDNPASPATSDRDWRTETIIYRNYIQRSFWTNTIKSSSELPNPSDYFFLPASGYYYLGKFDRFGDIGYYWSSNSQPQHDTKVFVFSFWSGVVGLNITDRTYGFSARSFE